MEERKIVVVGAGLTGLTCAAYLRRKGQDVVVLEATDRIGGLMQTEEVDGFVMEQGPSTGTIKYPEASIFPYQTALSRTLCHLQRTFIT